MFKFVTRAAIATSIVLGAITATVTPAAASGAEFGFGFHVGGPDDGWGRHHGRDRWDRRGGVCAPGHAVEKARWSGMRRAFVSDIGPRRVVVAGYRHGRPDRMVFANDRGCPVIHR